MESTRSNVSNNNLTTLNNSTNNTNASEKTPENNYAGGSLKITSPTEASLQYSQKLRELKDINSPVNKLKCHDWVVSMVRRREDLYERMIKSISK